MINHAYLYKSLLSAIVSLVLLSGSAIAQIEFDPNPEPEITDPEGQDDPIVIRPEEDQEPFRPFQTPFDEDEIPDQAVLLNTKYAGWQAAGTGTGGSRISNDLRSNWIMVDSNGRFEGTVRAQGDADTTDMIVYLIHAGRLVKDNFVSLDGRFEFNNVTPGAYSLIGWGPQGFFAFGTNILDYNPEAVGKIPRRIDVLAFQNETTINTDWIRHFAPQVKFRVYGRYPTGQGQDDPTDLYGFDGLVRFPVQATPATSLASHKVVRTADDRLIGRVHQFNTISGRPVDVRSTTIMLFQADEVIASTTTDNYGVFEFKNIDNGHYGIVATGADGMGMIGINVADRTIIDNGDGQMGKDGDFIDFCMVSSETVGWLKHTADEVAYRRSLIQSQKLAAEGRKDNPLCENCGGQGCQNCNGTGLCKSRQQSFEDWAARCYGQQERTRLGSGYILSEAAKDIRRAVDRGDNLFEKAFNSSGALAPANSPTFNNNGYGN